MPNFRLKDLTLLIHEHMNLLKFSFFLLICLLCSGFVHAQQKKISFQYDDAGNRTLRELVSSKSTEKADSTFHTPIAINEQEFAAQQDAIIEKSSNTTEAAITDAASIEVSIYPNPTKGPIQLSIKNGTPGNGFNAKIVDSQGKIINSAKSIESDYLFDISHQPPGSYYLIIDFEGQEKSWVIIKQ